MLLTLIAAGISWALCAELNVRANDEVLRTLAEIGATLLVAYGVLASSIVRAAQEETKNKRRERVGAFVGIGGAGLLGIGGALVLSQRTGIADPSWIEELTFGWTTSSLLMFLFIVALQAEAIDSWSKPAPAIGRSRWLTRNRHRSN